MTTLLHWQTEFQIKVVAFISSTSMGGWIGRKALLFGNLFSLADISKLFELINTLEGVYFLLLTRSGLILSVNMEALTTRAYLHMLVVNIRVVFVCSGSKGE